MENMEDTMKKCLRCNKEINESNGYETEDGRYIHHGCAMMMDTMPRKKMSKSLADIMAAKKKVDAINRAKDERLGRS